MIYQDEEIKEKVNYNTEIKIGPKLKMSMIKSSPLQKKTTSMSEHKP